MLRNIIIKKRGIPPPPSFETDEELAEKDSSRQYIIPILKQNNFI
jgi:hypothetical protein